MKSTVKLLLLFETTVCFAPAAVLLVLGLMILPTQIYFFFASPEEPAIGPLLVIVLTVGGVAGLVALTNLLLWILNPASAFIGRYWTLAGAITGNAALLPYAVGPVDSHWWRLVGLMPLACAVHLMYLGRDFLFRGRR